MKKILFVLLLALSGCHASANVPPTITVMHDDTHAVTCWLSTYDGASAIACLPNSMVEDSDDSGYEPESSAAPDTSSTGTSILSVEIFGL